MATYEEIMNAARNAHNAGDADAARRLVQMAQSVQSEGDTAYQEGLSTLSDMTQNPTVEAPERGFMHTVLDNVVGIDDGVMSPGEKAAGLLNAAGEGMTFGLIGDEADAAMRTAIGRDGSYDEALATVRGNEAQLREENPYLATTAEVLGGMVVPGGAMAMGKSLLGRMGMGILSGGAGAGTYGFMEGEGDERLQNAVDTGILGGALGGAIPVVGAGISRAVRGVRNNAAIRRAAAAAPSREELATTAGAMFDSMKDARIPAARLPALADDIAATGRDYGMDSMLMPNAARVSDNIADMAQTQAPDVGWQDLNILRRQAAVPAGNLANRPESAVGTRMIEALDDFVDEVAPELGEQGAEARRLWGVLRRSDLIDGAFERAKTAASGFENGLQIEFRRILRNPKLLRGFDEAEIAAMNSVVNGGVLHGLLRQVGRLGFSLDGGSNAVGGIFGAVGGATINPVGGILVPAIGTAARRGSEALRTRAANKAAAIVRTSNPVQLPVTRDPTQGILGDILLRSVRAGSAATAN